MSIPGEAKASEEAERGMIGDGFSRPSSAKVLQIAVLHVLLLHMEALYIAV